MNTWVRKSFNVGILSAGVLLAAGNAASADWNSVGNSGILSGNQINAQVQAPIDVCGNAIGVLGDASAGCHGGSWASLGGDAMGNWNSFGNSGIGSGNQINAQIQAPIDVCGNAIGIFGNAHAGCKGGAWATLGDGHPAGHQYKWHHKAKHAMKTTHVVAHGTEGHKLEATTLNSFGNSGIGSGNQVNLGLQIPINVCGNAVGLFGNVQASCTGGSTATAGGDDSDGDDNGGYGGGYGGGGYGGYPMPGHAWGEGTTAKGVAKSYGHEGNGGCETVLNSFGNHGVLSGNQVNLQVQAPVEISGNAVGVLGDSAAYSVGGAWANC